eukprot:667519-Hanusia_phi.AAC.1
MEDSKEFIHIHRKLFKYYIIPQFRVHPPSKSSTPSHHLLPPLASESPVQACYVQKFIADYCSSIASKALKNAFMFDERRSVSSLHILVLRANSLLSCSWISPMMRLPPLSSKRTKTFSPRHCELPSSLEKPLTIVQIFIFSLSFSCSSSHEKTSSMSAASWHITHILTGSRKLAVKGQIAAWCGGAISCSFSFMLLTFSTEMRVGCKSLGRLNTRRIPYGQVSKVTCTSGSPMLATGHVGLSGSWQPAA